ncbi:hypothetical protein MBLNU457_g0990t1 [Dothideomycetes sp. NU457]
MALLRYVLIPLVIGFILGPTHESQSQGRLIFAPPYYVQHNMFSVDFWDTILPGSGKNSFFYPAHILPQLLSSDAKEHNDARYAQELKAKHAGMHSDVAIDPNSVVRLDASEGSYWTGLKITHELVFSARTVKGANGTCTVFEYTRAWRSPILLYTLQRKGLLPRWWFKWFEIPRLENIDSEGIDLFRVEVEKAWKRLV